MELSSFRNTLALDRQGNCCGTGSLGQCTSHCETFFRICLLEYLRDIPSDVENTRSCTFGEEITPVLGDNTFDIPSGPSEENNFVNPLKIQLDFDWPVSVNTSYINVKRVFQHRHDFMVLSEYSSKRMQIISKRNANESADCRLFTIHVVINGNGANMLLITPPPWFK